MIFWTLWILLVAPMFWMLVCNFRTHSQRGALLEKISDANQKEIDNGLRYDSWRYEQFERVPYEEHLLRLFCFKSPWGLYPPAVRSLVKEN